MFSKIVKYLLILLVVVAVSIWFAENPGKVSLEWQGIIVDVPIYLALLSTVIVVGVCALVYRVWIAIRRSPKVFGHYRAEKRTHKGYDALTKGMVAVAAGDTQEANRHAKKADALLKDPGLTMLLSAQAAQLEGDEQAASRFFETMSRTKGMEFLGLRGLLNQAIAQGETDEALDLAKRAHRLKPKTQWLATNLFDLQVEKGQWAEAETTLTASLKNKVVAADQGRRHKGILLIERAREAEAAGQSDAAIKLLTQALKQDATLAPATISLAALLQKGAKRRKALSVIEDTWGRHPHPELYELYRDIQGEPDALKRVNLAKKLAAYSPNHPESKLAIATACLEARLWGEARDQLNALLTESPTARVCTLMAQLEESEHNDLSAARSWLHKATEAPLNPAWVCSTCGDVSHDWSAVCPKCGGFDTKHWQTPSQAVIAQIEKVEEPVEVELVEEKEQAVAAS